MTYFRLKGIGATIDDDNSLYVDAHSFEVQVSQSEIDWRADLYDEEFNNEGADTPS
jgi:hypothetical protein